MAVKKRADRTAQLAKRRQADEIAKQTERESMSEFDQMDAPVARTGVPGQGMKPLDGRPSGPRVGPGGVQSR